MNSVASTSNLNASLTVGVTGGSGFVGRALIPHLRNQGFSISQIRRIPNRNDFELAESATDVVIHLAGENIAGGRWTSAKKERILTSRVEGTKNLCEKLLSLLKPPRVFISSSAVGFYGNRGDEALDENSPAGDGFLAEVVRQWEAASSPLESQGIRVVHLRFGAILASNGGMLKKMILPFSLGLGGRSGSGRQFVSWISMRDAIEVISKAITDERIVGPVNVVSPQPVRNVEFAKTLAAVLRRPAIIPTPAFLINALFGELGRELILSGAKVAPMKLEQAGYVFRHSNLKSALLEAIGRQV